MLSDKFTIGTVLRTFGTLPALIRTTASRDHFAARLCETQTVVQAYINRAAACACSVPDRGRVTRAVGGGLRTVGIVALLRVGHHKIFQKDNQKTDENHVNVYNISA